MTTPPPAWGQQPPVPGLPNRYGPDATGPLVPPAAPAPQFPYPPAPPQFGLPAVGLPGLHPGNGLVRVHIQGSVMTSSLIVPSLLLDGRPVNSRYGENAYQLPPGRHRVELYAQWLVRYGQASLDVDVVPGAAVDVFYAAPFSQFTSGSIGLGPQRRKGVGWLVGSVAFLVIMMVFLFWSIGG